MNIEDKKFIIEEFKSNQCKCGNYKKPNQSFCYRCYNILPAQMKRNLYKRFTLGYEEAYEEAVIWLTENSDRFIE